MNATILHVDTLEYEQAPARKPNLAQLAAERTDQVHRGIDMRTALNPANVRVTPAKLRFVIETRDSCSRPWEPIRDAESGSVELPMHDLVEFCEQLDETDFIDGAEWRAVLYLHGVRIESASADLFTCMRRKHVPVPTLFCPHFKAYLPYPLHQLAERAMHAIGSGA
jgi:hypothetical protein